MSAQDEAAQQQEAIDRANAEYEAAQQQEAIDRANAEYEAAQQQEAIDRANAEYEAAQQQEARSGPARARPRRIALAAAALIIAFTLFVTIQLLRAGGSAANPTVAAAQARIVVNATDSDGRKTTFESVVQLSRVVISGFTDDELQGTGTGPFREVFVSDQCGFTITWSGQVRVEVVGRISEGRVQVDIGGPVSESGVWPGAECLDGTYYSPNRGATELGYSCSFDDVDFRNAGTYLGPPPEEVPNPYGCKLEFEPTR